jgi:hypothetical protein
MADDPFFAGLPLSSYFPTAAEHLFMFAGQPVSSYFEATPEDWARIASTPYLAPEFNRVWPEFASTIQRLVMGAYEDGAVSLERALQVVWWCSVGCTWTDRRTLLALTAVQAIAHPPKVARKKVKNPLWVRRAAAQVVQMSRRLRPLEALAPNEMNGWTTPILEDAILWLGALDLCLDMTPRVVYRWYCEAVKAGALEPGDVADRI